MDPLTHALAGAALAASLATEERLRGAAVAGALGALAPDLDVFISSARDPLLQLEMHRQFSHALITAPIIGALVGVLLLPVLGPLRLAWLPRRARAVAWHTPRRDLPFWQLALFAALGALSAGLLDACTSYGTQLLWPFSDARIAWSVVAVVDPVVTLCLALAVTWAVLRAHVAPAAAGAALAAVYLFVGAVQHERAAWVSRSLAAQRGHAIEAQAVKPTLGNLLLWRSVYRAEGRFWVDAVRPRLGGGAIAYPGGSIAVFDAAEARDLPARQRRDLQRFARLSDGYLVRHPRDARVIGDIRYAMSPDGLEPLWGIEPSPAQPRAHVGWRLFRDWSPAAWQRFRSMLAGAPLARLEPGSAARGAPVEVGYRHDV